MLNRISQKWLFMVTFALLCLIQMLSAAQHQLFGDEAFYWLESQHLDWSYAELPGWTQWMIALSQNLFPKGEFYLRIPSMLATFSVPILGMAISKSISPAQNHWQSGLLLLALPLLSLAGMLAIPDIWVVFFGLLAMWALILCIQRTSWQWFIILGLILAIGINVHIRFWILIFIAAIGAIYQYWAHPKVIKNLLVFTLPVMLIGFIPILIFNFQHDFPLLTFQLKERHPWSFQPTHLKFFFIQIIATTPLVFFLAFKTTLQFKNLNQLQRLVVSIAIFHWLLYAIIGFFSDDIRLNIHWTLLSYVLILIVASGINSTGLKTWSMVTGYIGSITLLVWLYHSMHFAQPVGKLNAQFTENARGWEELAKKTDEIVKTTSAKSITTDNFKTLSTLKFYLNTDLDITVLQHPLNRKHGRQIQLDIMQYTQQETNQNKLLVVEHSALKLQQSIPFYQQACETLNGIKLIDTLDYAEGIKTYYFFETGDGICHLPPVIYIEKGDNQLKGWILTNKNDQFEVFSEPNSKPLKLSNKDISNNPLIIDLNPDNYQISEFVFANISPSEFRQIMIKFNGLWIKSHRLYLN
jgi:hypothetical protein